MKLFCNYYTINSKLKFLLLSNTIFVFGGNLFVPIYALFVLHLNGGAELAGILIAVQFFVSFLTELIVIRLKDKIILDEHLLKANYLLRGFAWLMIAIFPSIPMLFLIQIINGIAEAIGVPSFNSLISENLDYKKHIKEWGTWELIKNPAIALASLAGGFIITAFGFNILFITMSCLAFLSLLVYQVSNQNIRT